MHMILPGFATQGPYVSLASSSSQRLTESEASSCCTNCSSSSHTADPPAHIAARLDGTPEFNCLTEASFSAAVTSTTPCLVLTPRCHFCPALNCKRIIVNSSLR